jgi:DNA primase
MTGFRSRIMFPICNSTGKVVAFTGRIIGADSGKDGVAKYVNSPETSVYHKSSILFAYDKAKQAIAQEKTVILVEGQMDAVMSHQAGVLNVVAISGTALTQEHVKILNRFADTVILSLGC